MADDKNNDKNKIGAAVAAWLKSQNKVSTGGTAGGKERLEMPPGGGAVEKVESKPVEEMVEIPSEPEIGKEVEGYIEKVEKAGELNTVVMDDYKQFLLKPAQDQKVEVKLPLTDAEIQLGLHRKVWEGMRWLAEWCVRQVKLVHGKMLAK